ncbi:hypothetical protein BJ138DRAFT_1141585 [Hygrophoropsis aurantiaca]|uniref:Uncharacterized protein n=1 Tax=Hygrophoropsis aurantiaca TaxID=72124 RepID=A0ACB8AQR4_9AGAM|nr:hypothetical protein BJ138DRAFT_1141585 [Hygrophoropsis aurantiaca]
MESHSRSPSIPSTPVSPRSPSPQRSVSQHRPSSRQGSISRLPQQGPLIPNVPQPSRTALNTPPVMPAPQVSSHGPSYPPLPQNFHPFRDQIAQQSSLPNMPPHSATQSLHNQGVYQGPSQGMQQAPQQIAHQSSHHSTHHSTHHRSRSRPPSAASHRYASSITPPVYGHTSSGTLSTSRTSLNGTPSRKELAGVTASSSNHHAALSPPPGIPASNTRPSGSPISSGGRSRSSPRGAQSSTVKSSPPTKESEPEPLRSTPAKDIHAKDIHRTQRPTLPASSSSQTQTRYVNMLLALDDIPTYFNMLASFFTWILLAGFILFPGTFANLQQQQLADTEAQILNVVTEVPLYIIAWICTGIGAAGMVWLWWRWMNNYVWVVNRIFVPGLLNSLAGVISTLANIYGSHSGTFTTTSKSTIIVTGAVTVITGVLTLVYQFWLLRNIKLEHDRQVGVERAGEHGEGVIGAPKRGKRE